MATQNLFPIALDLAQARSCHPRYMPLARCSAVDVFLKMHRARR
ncbi:hypothetical protein [Photorhabdus khanii]|nr:hypothetical protein [Photorhabdus khanii]